MKKTKKITAFILLGIATLYLYIIGACWIGFIGDVIPWYANMFMCFGYVIAVGIVYAFNYWLIFGFKKN